MFKTKPAALICVTLTLAACSGGNDPSRDAGAGGQQEACAAGFLPLKVGVKWTYQVVDTVGGGAEMKETIVEALEPVSSKPSQMAYRIKTRKGGTLSDETVSWQQRVGNVIARFQEQSFSPGVGGAPPTPGLLEWWDPYKLRIDESRLKQGESWTLTYKEYSRTGTVDDVPHDRNETWTVVGVNEPLTIAGTTYRALHLNRRGLDQNAASNKDYWFACGVGKLRETTAGARAENLVKIEGL